VHCSRKADEDTHLFKGNVDVENKSCGGQTQTLKCTKCLRRANAVSSQGFLYYRIDWEECSVKYAIMMNEPQNTTQVWTLKGKALKP
jgi:hypothetical protein